MPKSLIVQDCMVTSHFKETATLFPNACIIFHSYQQSMSDLVSSHLHQHSVLWVLFLCLLALFLFFCHYVARVVVFTWISLMTNYVDYLSMYLFASCIFSSVEYLIIGFLPIFCLNHLILLMLRLRILYIFLGNNFLLNIWSPNIFSKSVSCKVYTLLSSEQLLFQFHFLRRQKIFLQRLIWFNNFLLWLLIYWITLFLNTESDLHSENKLTVIILFIYCWIHLLIFC